MPKEKTISQKLRELAKLTETVAEWFQKYNHWVRQYEAARDEGGNPPPPPPPPPGENDEDGD